MFWNDNTIFWKKFINSFMSLFFSSCQLIKLIHPEKADTKKKTWMQTQKRFCPIAISSKPMGREKSGSETGFV